MAAEASSLSRAVKPDTVELRLRTLTPLYTGGVGQYGDQLHPSGILGSIRSFSCLLAAAVGDGEFEHACWGTVAAAGESALHSKRLSFGFDSSGLSTIELRRKIVVPGCDPKLGWRYNQAFEGKLKITITRLPALPDEHWNLLQLALRIQILHATFGAKDQFGLGILTAKQRDEDPPFAGLPQADRLVGSLPSPLSEPGLDRAFFSKLVYPCAVPKSMDDRLKAGLQIRHALRKALRPDSTKPAENAKADEFRSFRHYVMGALSDPGYGSAINVSAVYKHEPDSMGNDRCAIRIWGVLPHTTPVPSCFSKNKADITKRLRKEILSGSESLLEGTLSIQGRTWKEFGVPDPSDLASFINALAGLKP